MNVLIEKEAREINKRSPVSDILIDHLDKMQEEQQNLQNWMNFVGLESIEKSTSLHTII